jgi:hypothetical protein
LLLAGMRREEEIRAHAAAPRNTKQMRFATMPFTHTDSSFGGYIKVC